MKHARFAALLLSFAFGSLAALGCSSSESEASDGMQAGQTPDDSQLPVADDASIDAGSESDGEPSDDSLAMDECGLDTKWAGDEFCILPPPPDQGFQIHIGPSDYDNPEPEYVLEPGEEVTDDWPAVSGNTEDVYYYYRQYRMRPGSHHLIVSAGGGLVGRRLGGTQNLAKDNPERGIIAPENAGIGMPLAANTQLSNSLHYYNFGDKPIIKEVWVNFWYRDAADVTEPALEMFAMSPMNVAPGERVVVHGSCPITEAGRVLTLYGHVHANNTRFSAFRLRGEQRDVLYESFDWEHPLVLEYSSLVTNTASDAAARSPGGWNGVVDLMPGDTVEFECEIANMTNATFIGMNEAKTDEMCILVGDTVGSRIPGGFFGPGACTYQEVPQ